MDLLRTCYESDMIFSDGGLPVHVRWFRCDRRAMPFPVPHLFGSSTLDDQPMVAEIGEVFAVPKAWANGMRPAGLDASKVIVGRLDEFSNGQVAAANVPAVSVVNEPLQCLYPPGQVKLWFTPDDPWVYEQFTVGGVRFAPFMFPGPPDTFTLTLWNGPPPTDADGAFFMQRVGNTDTWTGETVFNCSGGGSFTASCSVVFPLDDTAYVTIVADPSTCGSGGTITGRGAFEIYDPIANGPFYAFDNTLPDFDSPPVSYWTFDA